MEGNNKTGTAVGRRAVLTGVAAAGIASVLPKRAEAKPAINVGVVVPLSGPNAQFGINARNGIQLVADEINKSGGIAALGGRRIHLVIADATSSTVAAATVAQRMVAQDKVVAVLGAFVSSLTIAISEVTERRGIPLLTMSFSDQITGRGFKNVFQFVPKASTFGRAQFDSTVAIAKSAGDPISRVAIAYEDTAYGTSQAKGLRQAAADAGVKVVMDEAYPLGITDITPLINRLRASNAQVLFPCSYLNDSLLIIRAMRQQGIDIPAIGGSAGYVIPDFVKALGDYAEGVLSVNPGNHDLAPSFTDRFQKRFGYFMVHEAIEHAVTMDVLAQAIGIAKSDNPKKIRDVLATTKFCDGWTKTMPGGCVEFDNQGLNKVAFPVMVQWQKGELVTVYPASVAKAKALWKGKPVP